MVDVVVIGAGLAGLRAAGVLTKAGLDVRVLEASDGLGGRVSSQRLDGFLLDRGFQVLNPAYTELGKAVDVAALRLQSFGRGVALARREGHLILADPVRHPRHAPALVGTIGVAEVAALAALVRSEPPASATLAEWFDAARVPSSLRADVLEPFLAGVIADDAGVTSARFVRSLLGWFAVGTPGLPVQGMAALPVALASGLAAPVEVATRVVAVHGGERVTVDHDHGTLTARAAVVAVDPPAASELTGRGNPAMRGLATWWFAAEAAPVAHPFLVVDPARRGPLAHAAVVSNAAPSYAPAGQHLVEASAVVSGDLPPESAVRDHVGHLLGADAKPWRLLAVDDLPHSLPALGAGWTPTPPSVVDGVVLAGDHQQGASVQGALRSGRLAAEAVIAALTGRAG